MKDYPFRFSSMEERKKYYEKEFSIKKAKNWFKRNALPLPQIYAIDAGSDTDIIINKKFKGIMFYFPFSELKEKIQKYLPEDIYYDRNTYKNPYKALKSLNFNSWIKQELVFDVDADNISCLHQKKYLVCNGCLKKAFDSSIQIKNILQTKFSFKRVQIVYSGRGFHVHVLDKKAFLLSRKQRKEITSRFLNFPIDEWVSEGNICLIKMPYSLNAIVSRKAIPFESTIGYDHCIKNAIPMFLKI